LAVIAGSVPATAEAKPERPGGALGKAAYNIGGGPFQHGVPRGIWVSWGHVPPNAGHGHAGRGHFWHGHGWGHFHHPGDHPNSP